ncbi:MAG: hypothetical protein WCC52_00370 [Nitrosotalea sp.]
MNAEKQKLFTIMVVIVLFSILGLSTVYAQTAPAGGMSGSGYSGQGGQGFQGQYGNSTSHGSHSGSFSHSGNFTRNTGASQMTSHSGNFSQNGAAYNMTGYNKYQNMPPGTNASSTIPSGTTTPGTSTPTAATMQNMLPPLQQFKSGTPANKISCEEGFQLIIKAEDGSPACVSSGTYSLLVERGWGH